MGAPVVAVAERDYFVSFGAGRRPEDATQVRLASFDGPLALLLALIEQRQLDILTVRLGDLAGAYLEALATVEEGRLPLLSSFVAVSSQLILIKSRELLPRPPARAVEAGAEEIDPQEELRRRLIEYRRYRDAGARLAARLDGGHVSFHREGSTAAASALAGARPPAAPALDARLLADALRGTARLVPPAPAPPEVMRRVVTLEERAAVIRRELAGAPVVVLQDILRDVTDRVTVAITFLAVLELVKGRELTIVQEEPWGPIEIRRRAAAEVARGR